jgi:hypothetical protein
MRTEETLLLSPRELCRAVQLYVDQVLHAGEACTPMVIAVNVRKTGYEVDVVPAVYDVALIRGRNASTSACTQGDPTHAP